MKIKNITKEIADKNKSKFIAGVLTVFILAVLVISSPAHAFDLRLSVDLGENHNFTSGDNIELTANFNINSNDQNLPIKRLILNIDGPGANDYACYFNLDGEKISGCNGITIELTSSDINYGYGYNYGYNNNNYYDFGYGYGADISGTLKYKITIDTDNYHLGSYKSVFSAEIGDNSFESDSTHFIVSEKSVKTNDNGNNGCITSWECTNWSSCINGKQIRTCSKEKIYCYVNPKNKPVEEQACTADVNKDTDNKNEDNQKTEILNSNSANADSNKGRLSRLTGAVTGAVTGAGTTGIIVVIVFLVGIIGLAVVASIIRKKKSYYS